MLIILKILIYFVLIVFAASFITTFFLLLKVTRRDSRDESGNELLERRRNRYGDIISTGQSWFNSAPWEDVYIISHDGLRLHGRWLSTGESERTVILVHGYHSSGAIDFCGISEYYANTGFNILMIDQRAHGKSEGRSISFGVRESRDVSKWAEFAAQRTTGDIYIHGVSMGAASVLLSADALPSRVCGLIADCPFASPKEVLAHQMMRQYHLPRFPFVAAGTLAGMLLDGRGFVTASTVAAAARSTLPLLLIGGEDDQSIPPEMIKRIYDVAAGEKTLLLVPHARHAVSFLVAPEAYTTALNTFMQC